MNNQSTTTVRTITSWEAQTITGIPAPVIVAWIKGGHLPAEKSMKGEREIYRFTLLALARHLLTPEAGKHQVPTVMVPVGDITLDPAYQLRAKNKLSLIREYAQLVSAGKKMPPIQLVRLPADKEKPARLIITDGWHRYYAHQHAGATHIPAQIIEHCGEAEAFALALAANGSHGLRRSKADNRHMLEAMLARPEYAARSYRELAQICGVSHTTVMRAYRCADQPQAPRPIAGGEKDPGTPGWIAAQIGKLAMKLQVTHPEVAAAITVQLAYIK